MKNLLSKIHIVHIIPTLNFGGAERFVIDLVNNLDKDKFIVSIIVLKNEMPLREQLKSDVKVYLVEKKGKLSLNLIGKIEKKLKELKADIVHTHLFGGDVWGRIAAKKLTLPIVTTEHNINFQEGFLKQQIKKYLCNYSDIYTAPSKAVSDYLKNVYQVKKNIKVIRHGIDLSKFFVDKKVNLKKPYKLLMLGRLTKQKGQQIVIKALINLREYDWRLEIVGSGEEEKNLKDLVNKNNLTEKIIFYPATKNVLEVLQRNDILLMPSLWEGLGIVAMEAMGTGLLVVASRVDGLKELIEDNKTGYLVEVGEIKSWTEKIKEIFEQPAEMQKIIMAGKNYAQKNFSLLEMVKSYEKVYNELLISKFPSMRK